jgi:coproporphyrinogen III oxidase
MLTLTEKDLQESYSKRVNQPYKGIIKDFDFNKNVGGSMPIIFSKIVESKIDRPWNDHDKELQLIKRGRYVEFNLLYDRGTKFGLMTDGNTEAILMSMPPYVKW